MSVVKKVSKDTNKEGVLSETVLHKVVNVADFVKHVSSINLEMKCNSLDCLCRSATKDRVNMGGYAYKHANDMLRAWLSTVHWVNDKLTGENAINLKGCTKKEVNGFACKIMDYLKPMTSLKNFTALRNFQKAGCVPDKLDNLFNDCQRPTATETEEIHMVVGVPRRLCKNPSKHPELVTVAIGGDWSETPMSGWMSVEQMRRNLEISCVLFETLNPILRCLVEKIQGTGVTHIFCGDSKWCRAQYGAQTRVLKSMQLVETISS